MDDAIFLAKVWKTIREQGWQSIVDFGDVDGIDFVANRVLEGSPTQRRADSSICAGCGHMDGYHPVWCEAGE